MLGGDPNRFAIQVVPVRPGLELRRQLPEAVWVGVQIWAGGRVVTRHRRAGFSSAEEILYLDARPIVAWLRANFGMMMTERTSRFFGADGHAWDVLGRWRSTALQKFPDYIAPSEPEALDDDRRDHWSRRHLLRFADTGATLPDLAFSAAEEGVQVAWRSRECDGGTFEFDASSGDVVVSRTAFIAAWAPLVAATRYREAVDESAAVEAAVHELQDLGQLTWSTALATAEDAEQEILRTLQAHGPASPMADPAFLASLQTVPAAGVAEALLALQTETLRTASGATQPANEEDAFTTTPEQQGYAAALRLRDAQGFDWRPIEDAALSRTLEACAVTDLGIVAGDRRNKMVCGRRLTGRAAVGLIDSQRIRVPWVRRMEKARGLGRVLLDRAAGAGATGGASSDVSAGPEHRRAGAFAAQLWLPETAIRKIAGHEVDAAAEPRVFERLMTEYGVGARTAAYQMWNHGLLSSSQMRNDLIDAYSGTVS